MTCSSRVLGARWTSGLGLVSLTLACLGLARATPDAGPSGIERPEGTVLTFYGLRRLEQDPNVADDLKVREWRAFIERTREQVAYAEKAIARWKDAAKLRLVESAHLAERDERYKPRQRIAQWQAVIDAYPRSAEAAQARKRIHALRAEETERLIREADAVEASGRSKVDRIQAWLSVVAWAPKTRAARASERRIAALQQQLFTEAKSVDAIARVDPKTKLEAWQDVLKGRPTAAQRAKAEARIRALEGGR